MACSIGNTVETTGFAFYSLMQWNDAVFLVNRSISLVQVSFQYKYCNIVSQRGRKERVKPPTSIRFVYFVFSEFRHSTTKVRLKNLSSKAIQPQNPTPWVLLDKNWYYLQPQTGVHTLSLACTPQHLNNHSSFGPQDFLQPSPWRKNQDQLDTLSTPPRASQTDIQFNTAPTSGPLATTSTLEFQDLWQYIWGLHIETHPKSDRATSEQNFSTPSVKSGMDILTVFWKPSRLVCSKWSWWFTLHTVISVFPHPSKSHFTCIYI